MSTTTSPPAEFSVRGFHAFVKDLNRNFPDMSATDWRDLLRGSFRLNAQQEKAVSDVTPQLRTAMQTVFMLLSQHVRNGGRLEGRIELGADNRRNAVVSLIPSGQHAHAQVSAAFIASIVIVCCDPECGDWQWFNG